MKTPEDVKVHLFKFIIVPWLVEKFSNWDIEKGSYFFKFARR
jgi:hypothetical protein